MDVIGFLNIRFGEGESYIILNIARSAISLIATVDINSDGLIFHFMNGIFRQRPTKLWYTTFGTLLLSYLKRSHPTKNLKLRDAAEKVATLLALPTAQKLQTLFVINIDKISRSESDVSIKITEQIKISKPGAF